MLMRVLIDIIHLLMETVFSTRFSSASRQVQGKIPRNMASEKPAGIPCLSTRRSCH